MKESRRRSQSSLRRKRPRVIKGLMRIGVGASILYLTAGTHNAVKLRREDVEKLETDKRKLVEEMEEEELYQALNSLSMEMIPLTEDEKLIATLASKYVLAGFFLLTNDESTF
ncbi:hypothetical protein EU528_10180 [Candidatus Thorarchaeota archaeon]|nr:MAG: hypothetical protein EU528_10180 [Candidatus Thorarchaeota archaeon]